MYSLSSCRNGYRKHYGTVFRIEVVDAASDKPIGTSVITTQGVLQQQRDYLIEEKGMPYLYFLMHGPLKFDKLRRAVVELRTGLNESDFFSPAKLQQTTTTEVKSRPGKTELSLDHVECCFYSSPSSCLILQGTSSDASKFS